MSDDAGPRRAEMRVLRSPWLYVAAVVALVTSPVLFWWALVLGGLASVTGLLLRKRSLLAAGLGLVVGGLPYPLLGILQQ